MRNPGPISIPPRTTPVRLGLALSGGGFRAMLYHIGVLRALRDLGLFRPNSKYRVTHITAASGGALAAAHFAMHAEAYCSPDDGQSSPASSGVHHGTTRSAQVGNGYEASLQPLFDLVSSDVRGRIFRSLPWFVIVRIPSHLAFLMDLMGFPRPLSLLSNRPGNSPTGRLEREYRKVFEKFHAYTDHHGRLLALRCKEHQPTVELLSTNVTTGTRCVFSGRGLRILDTGRDILERGTGASIIRIERALAASSAYPGFFPPARIRMVPPHKFQDVGTPVHLYTDAGTLDNLAIARFDDEDLRDSFDAVIASDASGKSDWADQPRLRFALPATIRTIDIILQRLVTLQKRVARNRERELQKRDGDDSSRFIQLKIQDDTYEGAYSGLSSALSEMRTDFDKFSDVEQAALVTHGYRITISRLRHLLPDLHVDDSCDERMMKWRAGVWKRVSPEDVRNIDQLSKGRVRKLRLLGKPTGVAWWMLSVLVVATIAFAGWRAFQLEQWGDRAEKRVEQLRRVGPPSPPEVRPQSQTELTRPRPDYEQFRVLRDARIFDMRRWFETSKPGETQPIEFLESSVFLTRRTKVDPLDDPEFFEMRFRTSGTRVDPWCETQSLKEPYVFRFEQDSRGRDTEGNAVPYRVSQIAIPMHGLEVPHDVDVVAQYVNAFQGEDQLWAGALVEWDDGPPIDLFVILPDEKAFTRLSADYKRRIQTGEEQPTTVTEFRDLAEDGRTTRMVGFDHRFYISPDRRAVLWTIENPRRDYTYRLNWDWKDVEPPEREPVEGVAEPSLDQSEEPAGDETAAGDGDSPQPGRP